MAMVTTESMTRDNLLAPNYLMPYVPGKVTIAANSGDLKRGALLTSEGKLVGTGDSDAVYAVLTIDVANNTAAVDAPVFFTGEFNIEAVSVAEGNTAADFIVAARNVGIFLREVDN